LGLTDWRVEFDIERENKSGGVTKGFSVLLYPPKRDKPIRFESYSGGETQRLRLAGDLGLANLIMERAGLTSMIEVYDEPASFLSAEGLLDVAETLHQRALTHGKRIFLIDHSTMDFGDAERLLVVKDERGSRLDLT
jgi:energy-coupling factor transporter ATP-binding protein EcfA2